MRAVTPIPKKTPGSELDRARGRYSHFDWHQSYEQTINFPVAAQARP
jgi:hypothetical protein